MKYLIDSDRVTDYLNGQPIAVDLLRRLSDDGIAVSVITLAEVYEGIYYGRDPIGNDDAFQRFLRNCRILPVDVAIARQYAMLRGHLRRSGLLVPQPDMLIAATAVEFDLTLVTRNLRHFTRMPDLRLYEGS